MLADFRRREKSFPESNSVQKFKFPTRLKNGVEVRNDQLKEAWENINISQKSRIEEVQKLSEKMRESEIDHKSQINNLKKIHFETIQIHKDEKDAQIQRLKVF